MPKYFFDTKDDLDYRDHIGCEFQNQATLRRGALKAVTGLLAAGGDKDGSYSVVLKVRDEHDKIVLVVRSVCQLEIPSQSLC
ncbi:DUF6894 family protein [Methylobacterium haplocladii]